MKQNNTENSLVHDFKTLLDRTKGKSIQVTEILQALHGRGYALMLIIIALPFCLPVQIPGFSTPFGLILAFLGLRIAFGHRAWIPGFLLSKTISHEILEKIAAWTIKVTDKLRFLIRTRMVWIVRTPSLHILHGITIAVLAILLALPLPIPLTNILSALPIVLFGLGMLEDDGLMIIIAYILSFICFAFFILLFLLGQSGITYLMDKI